jgi:hypothetical protein
MGWRCDEVQPDPRRVELPRVLAITHSPGESVLNAAPWLEPGSLRNPDRDEGEGAAFTAPAAPNLPPSPLPTRNSDKPPDRLDLAPPSSERCPCA